MSRRPSFKLSPPTKQLLAKDRWLIENHKRHQRKRLTTESKRCSNTTAAFKADGKPELPPRSTALDGSILLSIEMDWQITRTNAAALSYKNLHTFHLSQTQLTHNTEGGVNASNTVFESAGFVSATIGEILPSTVSLESLKTSENIKRCCQIQIPSTPVLPRNVGLVDIIVVSIQIFHQILMHGLCRRMHAVSIWLS